MICFLCNKEFKNLKALSLHLRTHNISKKVYYDKYMFDGIHNKCIICGNPTKFHSLHKGYQLCCSKKCTLSLRKQTNIKKYGVEYPTQNKKIQNKIQNTCLKKYGKTSVLQTEKKKNGLIKKYGVDNAFKSKEVKKKIKEVMISKYGVNNISKLKIIKDKKIKTCLNNHGVKYGFLQVEKTKDTLNKKYGGHHLKDPSIYQKMVNTIQLKYNVNNVSQSDLIKHKKIQTCLLNYGVEYPSQNSLIFNKIFKTSCKLKQYNDTNIYYQGSYELDFLKKYYDYYKIIRAPVIKYEYNEKIKVYYGDFLFVDFNIIIECKNSYLYKRDFNVIEAKRKASEAQGFKWILILDKNYKQLNNELRS